MAMNKKEKAEFEAAKKEALVNRALRWSDVVSRDVAPPAGGALERAIGYDFNEYSVETFRAWTSCVSHGKGHPEKGQWLSGSQRPRSLYSSPLLALKAMRNAVEMESAEKLARIDAQIAAELKRMKSDT